MITTCGADLIKTINARFATVGVAALAGLLATTDVAAQDIDWIPTLIPAERELRAPGDALRIQLPAAVTDDILQWLALELDSVDVSQIVQLETSPEGRVVVVRPPSPLEFGAHELRLVQYTEEGDIIERGVWNFDIQQTARFREASFTANTTLDISHRIDDDELPDLPSETQGQGASSVAARVAQENWEATAEANFLYDSVGVQTRDSETGVGGGREFDMGEFLFSGRTEHLSALVGHHAMRHQSLIMQGFHRRGISLTGSVPNKMLAASGFAFRTEPITGFRDGLGVGRHDRRVVGSMVTARPIPGQTNALAVTATYLRGQGEDGNGVGVSGEQLFTEGDGWSLVAESRLAQDRIKLRGEVAETDYDIDGDLDVFDEERDDAHQVLVEFTPWFGKTLYDRPMNWTFGAEYKEVGLFFRSLANPSLPFDKELARAFSTFQWGGLAFQIQAGREKDNVDDIEDLPKLRNQLVLGSMSYTPQPSYDESGQPRARWYGQPSFNLSTQYAHLKHAVLPEAFLGGMINQRTTYNQLGASFQYSAWSWSVGHGFGKEEDLTGALSDRRNELSDLAANWQIGERLLLGAQLQYNTITDIRTSLTTRSWVGNLSGEAVLVRDRLTAGINLSVNQDGASDDSVDTETRTYGFSVNWQAISPRRNWPGLLLWLRGERQEFEDELAPDNDRSPYQVFVGASVNWPVSVPSLY